MYNGDNDEDVAETSEDCPAVDWMAIFKVRVISITIPEHKNRVVFCMRDHGNSIRAIEHDLNLTITIIVNSLA
jgi:hypothetical protein